MPAFRSQWNPSLGTVGSRATWSGRRRPIASHEECTREGVEPLAAYRGEAWGGPPTNNERYANESYVARLHSGNSVQH